VLAASSALAQTRQAPARPAGEPRAIIDAAHPIMQAEEIALRGDLPIFGDVSKPGTYILRRELAANQTVRPHFADQDRWITVLNGTLWIGKGDVFKPDSVLPIRAGGVAFLSANSHYFEMAGQDGAVIQITGSGPVKTTHTEVDAKGQPVPETGPYPVIAPPQRKNPVDADLLDPDQIDAMERAAAAKKEAAEAAKKKAAPTK